MKQCNHVYCYYCSSRLIVKMIHWYLVVQLHASRLNGALAGNAISETHK